MNFNNTLLTQAKSVHNFNNFIYSYSLNQCKENLNKLFDHVTTGSGDEVEKVELLDFLESLEELLPALYELHKWKDPDHEKVTNEVIFENKH